MGGGDERFESRLRLLGPMTLLRDGREIALPASKKTRALLAYLAASDRPVRRDHLCTMLWDMPDDPRGALRWSLSKLRGLLDGRLLADRETVALDVAGLAIDWRELRSAAKGDLASLNAAELDRLAAMTGEFIEGLDLARNEGFQAWSIAQREDVRRWRCALLAAACVRCDDGETALGHAREWVRLDPFEGKARIALIGLLEKTGRHAEVDGQRSLGVAKLREGDAFIPDALLRSFPAPESAASLAHRQNAPLPIPVVSAPAPMLTRPPLPVQQVRFCTASDDTGLAWSRVGEGPPLVKTANWLNHLEYDWDSPVWRHWIDSLSRGRSLIRYDERGNGLSDWNADDISFEAFVDDLSSVVDAAGIEQFDLLGVSQGCSVSIAYAVRNPGRVRRMVLYGGYAAGWRLRQIPGEIERRNAMATLMREGWGQNNPAFRQMYTTLFFPDASHAEMDWFNELQRMTTSPANAYRLQNAFADIDVRDLLAQVGVPTLVVHARDDAVIPFAAGRALAAAIPGARFIALEGRNHLLLETEPAWTRFLNGVEDFLAEP